MALILGALDRLRGITINALLLSNDRRSAAERSSVSSIGLLDVTGSPLDLPAQIVGITVLIEAPQNVNCSGDCDIVNAVRKAPNERSTYGWVKVLEHDPARFREAPNGFQTGVDRVDQFDAKAGQRAK